jgi:hypothetical protein
MNVDQLLGLETAVWQALVEGDVQAVTRLLGDDFVGVSPTGFSVRADHAGQLVDGPTVRRFQLSEVRMLALSDSALLLMYRARYVRTGMPTREETMYVSSLWRRRGADWVNVFSQDTPDTGVAVV